MRIEWSVQTRNNYDMELYKKGYNSLFDEAVGLICTNFYSRIVKWPFQTEKPSERSFCNTIPKAKNSGHLLVI